MRALKTIVVYETEYGNTEAIANAIADPFGGDSRVVRGREAQTADLNGIELLIVGAPTYGGRPMPPMQAFLDKLPASSLAGIKVAAFDTRLVSRFARLFGYAADKIDAILVSKGGAQITPPEGFLVRKTKGPLLEGELERAKEWGKAIKGKTLT